MPYKENVKISIKNALLSEFINMSLHINEVFKPNKETKCCVTRTKYFNENLISAYRQTNAPSSILKEKKHNAAEYVEVVVVALSIIVQNIWKLVFNAIKKIKNYSQMSFREIGRYVFEDNCLNLRFCTIRI